MNPEHQDQLYNVADETIGAEMTDQAQWFDGLGKCRCGKNATGILRGTRNESYGPYCPRCAEARIKKAQRERERSPPHPAAVYLAGLAKSDAAFEVSCAGLKRRGKL